MTIEVENFLKYKVWHALIAIIRNASKLHRYTVKALYKLFQTSTEYETFVRVEIWFLREYGYLLINNVEMFDIEDPITVTESDVMDAA